MIISKVQFQQFRNLEQFAWSPSEGTNILLGRNAQGKTNILEGIFAVGAGGSFRVSNERVLITRGQEFARAGFGFEVGGETKTAEVVWEAVNGIVRKTTKLNGVEVLRTEVIRQIPMVLFSPEDIDLIRLSPQKRRKFLDLLIARFDLGYGQDLIDFWKVLRQRNQLLLMIKQGRSHEDELLVWDEKMSELGARIVAKRKLVMEEVGRLANQYYHEWFGESGDVLNLVYVPNLNFPTPVMYGAGLAGARSMDIARANTTKGIHRDDISFLLNGNDMRTSASRGEFRSAVMALKLAEGEMLKQRLGEEPVYLLDDIFSELDHERQGKLAKALVGVQCFVSTNDKSLIKLFENPAVVVISDGRAVEEVVG